jgi:hypothetical protein
MEVRRDCRVKSTGSIILNLLGERIGQYGSYGANPVRQNL